MIHAGIWQFEIINNKIVIDGNPDQVLEVDEQRAIAKQLLDDWWNRRIVSFDETEYRMGHGDNERSINRCLILEEDAYLVDVYDITVFVPFAQLRPLAVAIRNRRNETLNIYDEKKAAIESEHPSQLPSLIDSIVKLT